MSTNDCFKDVSSLKRKCKKGSVDIVLEEGKVSRVEKAEVYAKRRMQ